MLIKGVSQTVNNEAKEQQGRFVSVVLRALSTSILGNMVVGKEVLRAGKETTRAGQDF